MCNLYLNKRLVLQEVWQDKAFANKVVIAVEIVYDHGITALFKFNYKKVL